MAQLSKSSATLRISGDDLVPDEVTRLLGTSPTHAQSKGEPIFTNQGTSRIAKLGMWRLNATVRKPGDLDGQIQEILGQMTTDLSVWTDLHDRYEMDLFCGLIMDSSNEGIIISPVSLRELGSCGIELGLDIYRSV
jgi:hypothetical protein